MVRPTAQEVTAMKSWVLPAVSGPAGPHREARVGRGGLGEERETVGEPLHYGFLGKDQVNHR